MDYSIGDFFSSVIKLFALLTPPAALSAFLSGTQTYGGRRKRRTALRTGTAVFIVGTVLYFFGESLFSYSASRWTPSASAPGRSCS